MLLSNYITGKAPLWRAFWFFCVIGPTILMTLGYTAPWIASSIINIPISSITAEKISLVFYGATTITAAFGTFSVWQCKRNCGYQLWTWLAVLFVIIPIFINVLIFFFSQHIDSASFILTAPTRIIGSIFLILYFIWLAFKRSIDRLNYRLLLSATLAAHIILTAVCIMHDDSHVNIRAFAYLKGGNYSEGYFYSSYTPQQAQTMSSDIIQHLSEAAESGDIDAAYELGMLYTNGKLVQQNYTEALKWLQLAATNGHVYAKNNLAVFYAKGMGVTKNPTLAFKLYKEASDAGDYLAAYNIGLDYELGVGVPKNYKAAASYYKQVIQRADKFENLNCADNDLGALYATGKGVAQDDNAALNLFKAAAMKKLTIPLPRSTRISHFADVKNFADIFSIYRLAMEKQTPLSDTKLTTDQIAMAKVVTDFYKTECRE